MVFSWLRERRAEKARAAAAERERQAQAALASLDARWDEIEREVAELHKRIFPREAQGRPPLDMTAQLAELEQAAEDDATWSHAYDMLIRGVCGRAFQAANERRLVKESIASAGAAGIGLGDKRHRWTAANGRPFFSRHRPGNIRAALSSAQFLLNEARRVNALMRQERS